MLQAILQKALNDRGVDAEVSSAGLVDHETPVPASPNAQAIGVELGFDLSGHRSRMAKDLNPSEYDHVYCMERKLAIRLEALGYTNVESVDREDVPNPWEKGIEAYRETARVLVAASTKISDRLATE